MTVNELYYICENMGPKTPIRVMMNNEQIFYCTINGIPGMYSSKRVKGFFVEPSPSCVTVEI